MIASEYGWSYSELLSLPFDTLINFYEEILKRKKSEYKLLAKIIAIATNCGFSGKMDAVDRLFKDDEPLDGEAQVDQLRQLCSDFGIKTEDFEKQLKEGKIVI